MKKLFYFILGVLLFLPTLVKADMGAPIIKEYKASIINPNGAKIYELDDDDRYAATEETIAYGKEVFVENEDDIDDGFVNVNLGDAENSYIIKLKDISLVSKNYKVNKNELTDKEPAIVLKEIRIRKGPAEGYDSTGVTLEKGTKINIQWFKDPEEKETDPKKDKYDSDNPWVYVEYNGTKGFINILNGAVAYREVKTGLMTNTTAEICDIGSNKVMKTIPVNTIINGSIYLLDDWSSDYYIVYDGTQGYVNEYYFVSKSNEKEFKTNTKVKVYDAAGDNKIGKVITTLPKESVIKSSFYSTDNTCNIYYEKDGVKGWIYNQYNDDGDCGLTWEEDLYDENIVEEEKPVKKGLSVLYIGVGSVIVLTLVIVTTIVLVNKKKREN